MLKVGVYVKTVLTIIAICLIGLLFEPFLDQEAQARMSTGTGRGEYTIVMSEDGAVVVRLNTVTGSAHRWFSPDDRWVRIRKIRGYY